MHATLLQVRKIIDALPQRKFMKDDDIQRWIDDIWQKEPDRIIWHANRLNGWGGSEIGILVADMRMKERNEFSPTYHTFKSANELFKEKLCINTPTRDEDENENDIRRGTIGEPWLIDRLIDQLKNQYGEENVKIDKDTMAAMGGTFTNPEHPWLVGNIDLSLIVNELRLLVDIKWPRASKAEYMAKMTPFTYDCQLKHYELRAEKLNVPIGFDKTVLACFDSDQFSFHLGVVEGDKDLKADIIRAGDHYFNEYLLKGRIPDLPKSKTPTGNTEMLSSAVNANLKKVHALKVLKKSLDKQIDSLEKEISCEINTLKLPPHPKLDFAGGLGSIKGKAKCSYNDDLLSQYAPKYGIKCDEMTDKVRTDIHTALMADSDISNNEILSIVNPEYTFTYPLTRARKGAIYDKVKELSDTADELVSGSLESLENRMLSTDDNLLIEEKHRDNVAFKPVQLESTGNEIKVKVKNAPQKLDETEGNSKSRPVKKDSNQPIKKKPIVIERDDDTSEDDDLKDYFTI